jgi:hypothetical protein
MPKLKSARLITFNTLSQSAWNLRVYVVYSCIFKIMLESIRRICSTPYGNTTGWNIYTYLVNKLLKLENFFKVFIFLNNFRYTKNFNTTFPAALCNFNFGSLILLDTNDNDTHKRFENRAGRNLPVVTSLPKETGLRLVQYYDCYYFLV